jgi:hypothetical protein
MSSPLRSILAEFGFEVDHAALEKGEKHVQGFIKTIEHVGSIIGEAFIVREVYEFVAGIVETSSALERMAIKTGVATDELQALEYAAYQSDIAAESLDGALGKLGKALFEASGGSKEAAKSFHDAGISTKDAQGHVKSAADALPEIADAFTRITNPSERAALAIKFFGKSGTELIPLLAKGSEGIRELTDEAKALGGGLSKEAIEGAAKLEEESKRLKFSLTSLKSEIAVAIMPTLAGLAHEAVEIVKAIREWTKNTKIIEAATVGFGIRGVLSLVKHLGGLGGILRVLQGVLFRTIAPMLLLEDLFVFFAGGKSALGETLDKAFGKGTQEKVRGLFKEISDGIGVMISDWEESADKFSEKWYQTIRSMPAPLAILFAMITAGFDIITGQWDAFGLAGEKSFDRLRAGWNTLLAWINPLNIGKSWDELLAKSWEDIDKEHEFVTNALAESGGTPDVQRTGVTTVDRPRKGVTTVDHPKGKAPAKVPATPKERVNQATQLGDLQALYTATLQATPSKTAPQAASAPVTSHTSVDSHNRTTINAPVSVTVPPGTPEEVARDVGAAAGKGVKRASELEAAHAALVTTGG